MGWPFSSVGEPNLDTGPGIVVPVGAYGAIETAQVWLTGAALRNEHTTNQCTITIANTAGDVLEEFKIGPGQSLPYEWAFRPSLGLKWKTNNAGARGHLWGYK